jgi:hypothetical protein
VNFKEASSLLHENTEEREEKASGRVCAKGESGDVSLQSGSKLPHSKTLRALRMGFNRPALCYEVLF